MIELTGIYKTYQAGHLTVPVLKNINFTVEQGEYVAIMGPSGSGKSTLMNIIGCLDRPTKGHYLLNGKDVSTEDEVALASIRNRTIGFIFQQFQLLPRMDAQKNVELPLIYAGLSKSERQQRSHEALQRVGLADRKNHRPAELSGGQQQRVAIARALVNQPLVLLADEPTGALDSHSSRVVLDLFDALHDEGRTIVMITHDPEVAERAQRQIVIRDGEIIADEAGRGGRLS
ncbi:ABC transporter ATP-binding protein [Paenactinomyces guangxiensis]|uniref:ABC transporter ATP-binding protein n=1 Tax=Paenactinomyces guangxiensis TaxID=1490290 RepID=A0A7W1WUV8_9BACL|nr:ABC transporter ATP-binding protein [Paenactinomyces guangxiensis]MBA4496491.1 ABC transporter ATP-binding protein [Paenactinomyces guangxiensis]MBH8592859.1 ABC transporter ATP-binding protein [Paenactinomyces guangxiensis]